MILSIVVVGALMMSSPTTDQAKRIERLENKLMAPCCYSQNIHDHMSQEAAEMRDEVMEMVEAGESEQDIITYYRTKYGERILAMPDGKTGEVAYTVPVTIALLALLALFAAIFHSARNRNQNASASQKSVESLVTVDYSNQCSVDPSL